MIQWFPGHMLKAQQELKKSVSKVDIVLEILDARLPLSSSNPFVEKICQNKYKLKVLNKKDIADSKQTSLWLNSFAKQQIPAIAICGIQKTHTRKTLNYYIKKVQSNSIRKTKVMILGIPNTGKSTILNSLVSAKIAKTANTPAITRIIQRAGLKGNIDIYDTPGILWPVLEPEQRAYILATSGAISDSIIDYIDLAFFAGNFLIKKYPDLLIKRYPFLKPLPEQAKLIIKKLAIARGCFKKDKVIDYQKACQIFIHELRKGKIGKISFETPNSL